MASARGTTRVGVRKSSRAPVVEEIVPNSVWTEDSAGHYLLVDLPEFKKEEVKLQVDGSGQIIVEGERHANERKRVHFKLTFPGAKDSDMDNLAGKFDGGILHVTVPKRIAQENKESEAEKAANGNVERAKENKREEPNAGDWGKGAGQHECHREKEEKKGENAHMGGFSEELIRNGEQETMLRSAVEVLRKNKAVIITAVIAFSLGFLISRKFQHSAAS